MNSKKSLSLQILICYCYICVIKPMCISLPITNSRGLWAPDHFPVDTSANEYVDHVPNLQPEPIIVILFYNTPNKNNTKREDGEFVSSVDDSGNTLNYESRQLSQKVVAAAVGGGLGGGLGGAVGGGIGYAVGGPYGGLLGGAAGGGLGGGIGGGIGGGRGGAIGGAVGGAIGGGIGGFLAGGIGGGLGGLLGGGIGAGLGAYYINDTYLETLLLRNFNMTEAILIPQQEILLTLLEDYDYELIDVEVNK